MARMLGWRLPAALLLMLALALPGGTARAQADLSFSLRPANPDPATGSTSYFIETSAPGTAKTDELLVMNRGSTPITLELYVVDAATGPTSGAVYPGRDVAPKLAGTWIKLPQSRIVAAPDSTTHVPFELQVPSGVRPGQYLAGIVAQPADAPAGGQPTAVAANKEGQFSVKTLTRVVVAVAVIVPGPVESRIVATDVTAASNPLGTQLTVAVRNEGNTLVKGHGILKLRDENGVERASLPVELDTIVPGDTGHVPVPWPADLAPGRYLVDLTIETTDALPAGTGAGGGPRPVPSPGRAELRARPLTVAPSTVETRPAEPGQPQQTVIVRRDTAGGLPSWWPIAAAVALVLLLANVGLGVWLYRRRRPIGAAAGPTRPPEVAVVPQPTAFAQETADATVAAPPTPIVAAPAPAAPPIPIARPRPASAGEGVFVKGRGATIYLLQDGVKRPLAGWQAFVACGGRSNLSNVRLLPDDALNAIPTGSPISAPEDARTA